MSAEEFDRLGRKAHDLIDDLVVKYVNGGSASSIDADFETLGVLLEVLKTANRTPRLGSLGSTR